MRRLRDILKFFIRGRARRILSGLMYGWHGNYTSWDAASLKCSGYDTDLILQKVKQSALKVKEGAAAYERDSFIFSEVQYSYELLSALMWIAARNHGKLNILDFGGSLGSTYYQNKLFLDSLEEVNWCIVEQPGFVQTGKELFEDERLRFFNDLNECFRFCDIDVVLFSSVLQYLENPHEIIDQVITKKPEFIIIDRTPFTNKPDRITVQKVNPSIYRGSYPCWFLNKSKFISRFTGSYKLIFEFESLDKANISSEFKGMLFERI
jgi:putative methyltransferase (TIGR04325 family)